ncbi:unnamed protein product, partial [Ectocarpus sp. 12 AP-2014]
MLRRLVRRFNEEGGAGAGCDAAASSSQNGGTSTNAVTEIELDIDSGEDETERWIMEAGTASGLTGGFGRDARASGRRVWLPDKAAVWRIAEVVSESTDGSSYTVLAKDGKRETEA